MRFNAEQGRELAAAYRGGATIRQLAARYDSGCQAVRSALIRAGEPLRRIGRAPFWTDERRAWAVEQYGAGRSQWDIAAELGVSQATVSRVLRDAGVPTRRSHPGEDHSRWNGGRIRHGGYVWVRPTAEDLAFCVPNATGYVAEHRLVMGRALGRPLTPEETVRHIDGRRDHNALENLQLRGLP